MKKHPILKTAACVLAAILIFLLVINIIPPKKNVDDSPFVVEDGELPHICQLKRSKWRKWRKNQKVAERIKPTSQTQNKLRRPIGAS